MSLKRKIVLGFLISASIIALLVVFEYINFAQMRREIVFLELTDTLRTKSLQIRRHEKNFFLYGPQKSVAESVQVHRYLSEMEETLDSARKGDVGGQLEGLGSLTSDYRARFDRIEASLKGLNADIERGKAISPRFGRFFPLIELTFMERPYDGAKYLRDAFGLPPDDALVSGLCAVDTEITSLRKTGEDIVEVTKDLDKAARDRVEHTIKLSQLALIAVFPLFLLIGLGMLFMILGSVTLRLRMLIDVVEHTGKGFYPRVPTLPANAKPKDEVDLLVEKFNTMEDELARRERELGEKNEELLQARKLAAIGTLASGVAHELNNPLNNIYLAVQVLSREIKGDTASAIKGAVDDIVGQTARVKRIVRDLLEFARGSEPEFAPTDIGGLIRGAYSLLGTTRAYGSEGVVFRLDAPAGLCLDIDPNQMERVFINLFTNAIDAMNGKGELAVRVSDESGAVRITVSDTGPGIPPERVEKIFEPFYTTKDRGTGLGLAIVFNIVGRHGGDIRARNKDGGGAVFEITLYRGNE
ncbi:MAG: ATP-binding protein [Nitrospirota bacterium]